MMAATTSRDWRGAPAALEGALAQASDAVLVLQRGRVVYWNGGGASRLGYAVSDLVGRPLAEIVVPSQRPAVQANYARRVAGGDAPPAYDVHLRSRGGEVVVMEARPTPIDWDGRSAVLVVARDVTEQRDLEGRLRELATRDSLTGLWTRGHFLAEFATRLGRAASHPSAFLYLDLDDLKRVNDRHGHAAGDAVLRAIGGRIALVLRAADLAGRLGGDEFGVYLPNAGSTVADAISLRLLERCGLPVQAGDALVSPTISVGQALVTDAQVTADVVLTAGDQAMYRAKARGGGRVGRSSTNGSALAA